MASILSADKAYFRFIILFFNCLLTFGSYFCFDMPSVLQSQFQGNFTCEKDNKTEVNSTNTTCCVDCLGMNPDEYNLLYAIYAWTNAIVVIAAGFLVDKLGNRLGIFLFSSFCVLGSSIFALGAMFPGTSVLLPIMLLGRLLFGAGNGSLTIVQNRITAFWFKGKELALAFGITLAFSRLGSVLNFFTTGNMYAEYGLSWTLWIGAMLCAIGFFSGIAVSFLDIMGINQLGRSSVLALESKKLHITDIRFFSLSYWLLAITIMFFYNGVFPFVADASKFIQDKYGYDPKSASYVAGAVYDVSMIMSPFLGGIIDVVGKRGVMAVLCAVLTIPVFGLLAFTNVYPLVSTLWLGVTYSVAAASLWPSIPLVVSRATIGTAMGLTTSIQMIGIGISNLLVGVILGKNQGHLPQLLAIWGDLSFSSFLPLTSSSPSRFVGGVLNLSKKQMNLLLRRYEEETDERPSSDVTYEQTDPSVIPNPDSSDQDALIT
ncbi:major facilitator superfamily domain-containing protein 1-like [Limulus polyphemus]|uniref:Lysosomal dipeptide transporter MFSD1 n=1 Tax=Limulus polyphemus TaxID=6850 RepID=A0ABM1BT59_LIMPO|nr:major facilitator superfamily domain-containing protein 1-like [Limulus polyphemus]